MIRLRNHRANLILCLLAWVPLAMQGCGSTNVIRNEPPFVRIDGIRVLNEEIDVELSIRNLNTEPLQVSSVRLEILLDEVLLASYEKVTEASVVANGTDELVLQLHPTPEGQEMLTSLEQGEVASLPYRLEGDVETPESGRLKFKNEGHVYPVPGRPGHFR